MKRSILKRAWAIALILLMAGTSMAAEWPQGRDPSQPYSGVPRIDLEQKMGYIFLYPRVKVPAYEYCDTLEIYLPRDDIELAGGFLHLYEIPESGKAAEVAKVSFGDADAVRVRPLNEEEMEGIMWGGGVCIEVRLPVSLGFDGNYYVLMDEGCFTAANGKVVSIPIANPDAWVPVLKGDYGVGRLYYTAGGEEGGKSSQAFKQKPEVGDTITFDLVMGGKAASAVIYSENDSVWFGEIEFHESAHIVGRVEKDELMWGVLFLDETGEVLNSIDLSAK